MLSSKTHMIEGHNQLLEIALTSTRLSWCVPRDVTKLVGRLPSTHTTLDLIISATGTRHHDICLESEHLGDKAEGSEVKVVLGHIPSSQPSLERACLKNKQQQEPVLLVVLWALRTELCSLVPGGGMKGYV